MSHSYPTRWPKARKATLCTWCAEEIQPGETYARWANIGDAGYFTNKMHAECLVACREDAHANDDGYAIYDNERPVVAPTSPTPAQDDSS